MLEKLDHLRVHVLLLMFNESTEDWTLKKMYYWRALNNSKFPTVLDISSQSSILIVVLTNSWDYSLELSNENNSEIGCLWTNQGF